MRKALVLGAGGFIGHHMVTRLKSEGFWIRGVDLKHPLYAPTEADEFKILDLTLKESTQSALFISEEENFEQIYQFAADMGGAGFIFTGENDADVMYNSAVINLNVLSSLIELNRKTKQNKTKIFYSSSACIYPEENQLDPDNPNCAEDSAYPANPDSEYGWEKLFSERLYLSFSRNYGIPIAIARYHNIFGPLGTWEGGREKSPAAICRKIAQIEPGFNEIEVWGDGNQTRSFLFVSECIEATRRLMESNFLGPVNIGSEEMVTINQLVDTVAKVAGKSYRIKHKLDAPTGVRGRNSNNDLVREKLNWDFELTLKEGIEKTYLWIEEQLNIKRAMELKKL
jgi:nucleoside-diphosphate-sugar epimerase